MAHDESPYPNLPPPPRRSPPHPPVRPVHRRRATQLRLRAPHRALPVLFPPPRISREGSLRIVVPRHTFTIPIPLLRLLDASPNLTLSVVDTEGSDTVADALIDIRSNEVWRSYVTTHVRHLEYLREKKFPCLRFTLVAQARMDWLPGEGTSRVSAYHARVLAWLRDVGLELSGTEDLRVQITVAKD
jgi:hypothetical protein